MSRVKDTHLYLKRHGEACSNSSWELERRELRASFFLGGPGLDGNSQNLTGHYESGHSHSDSENKHRIELVKLHGINHISGLRTVSMTQCFHQSGNTYTQHENQATGDQAESGNNLSGRTRRQIRGWWLEIRDDISHTSSKREANQQVTPLLVHHSGNHAGLVVGSHHATQKKNHQGRHWIERNALSVRKLPSRVGWAMSAKIRGVLHDSAVQPALNALRFEKHTTQTPTKEHNGDGHMLEICRRPFAAPTGEVLEEHVAGTVEEDHKRFGKFTGRDLGLPLANNIARGLHIPSPSEICPAAHESSQGQQTIPKEDASLDKMCETVEDLSTPLQHHSFVSNVHIASDAQNSLP